MAAVAGPGAARQGGRAGLDVAGPRHEVRHAGRDHQRARQHARDRLAGLAVRSVDPVPHRVLVAVERLLEDGDPRQPLHVLHPVPAGHHQPQREAVLGRQRSAVHLVREQRVAGLADRERALVGLRYPALDAAVEGAEEKLDPRVLRARLLEQRSEWRACPFRRAHRLGEPRLAERARLQQCPAVAGALEGDRLLHARTLPKLVEGEAQGALHRAADHELEAVRVDRRDVVVDQEVVQARGRDRMPQGLEREAVVTRGQPQLGRRDALVRECPGRRALHAATLARGRYPRKRPESKSVFRPRITASNPMPTIARAAQNAMRAPETCA